MSIKNGLIAGLIASIVLSIMMFIANGMNLVPGMNAIRMWMDILVSLGLPMTPVIGWIAHLLLGIVVWGIIFAKTYDIWPGGQTMKGIWFATAAWLLMMIVFMPMAGVGFFGGSLGHGGWLLPLILHFIYGTALGWAGEWLQARESGAGTSASAA